jgi:hypothetical protein
MDNPSELPGGQNKYPMSGRTRRPAVFLEGFMQSNSRRRFLTSSVAVVVGLAAFTSGSSALRGQPPPQSTDAARAQLISYLTARGWTVTRAKAIRGNTYVIAEATRRAGTQTLTMVFQARVVLRNGRLEAELPPSQFNGSYP